jgi:hypothetical protein
MTGNQIGSMRSYTSTGDRGGARVGKPRWPRILAITLDSSVAAIILMAPPQCGHCSMSILNTRFNRRAQLIRTDVDVADYDAFSSGCIGFPLLL